MPVILAGGLGLRRGLHSRMTGTIGDLYLTLASEVLRTGIQSFPTAGRKLTGIV